jgi:hypothetical protein
VDPTEHVYGLMSEYLTLRPLMEESCCGWACSQVRLYDVARDPFGSALAQLSIAPHCCFSWGCGTTPVSVVQYGGGAAPPTPMYLGELNYTHCLPGCLENTLKLEWSAHPSKPYMTLRKPAVLDCVKNTCCCEQVYYGWRGSSAAVAPTVFLYQSTVQVQWVTPRTNNDSWCPTWLAVCCDPALCSCCSTRTSEWSPNFYRFADEVRSVVRARYDVEMSCVDGTGGGAHKVDLLLSSRLYSDTRCCEGPSVRFANRPEAAGAADPTMTAAIDARYRGSLVHQQPTEADHLIVLAAAAIQAFETFPHVARRPILGLANPGARSFGRISPK